MYRLNELNVNNRNKPIDTSYSKIFKQVVNASMLVALAENIKQEKELINAKTENIKELEKVSAFENYQKGIKMILEKDEKNTIIHFKNMFKDYPEYFNIKEINKKIIDLSKEGMNDNKWKELYKFITNGHLWRIDENLQKLLIEKSK